MFHLHPIRIILAVMFAVVPTLAQAVWLETANVVCDQTDTQQNPEVASDGAGHVFVVWEDYRSGSQYDVYLQKVDSRGNALWAADGIPVAASLNQESVPLIVSDDAGGCIVAWRMYQAGNYLQQAQRFDADGNALWSSGPVTLVSRTGSFSINRAIADGSGGAILAWYDGSVGNFDIFAQRVLADGTVAWGADGVAACTDPQNQQQPVVCGDGYGGAIVAWYDYRNLNWDVFANRISQDGYAYWGAGGRAICTDTASQYVQAMVQVPNGIVMAWTDGRSGNGDIYAQKTDVNGNAKWTANGIPVSVAAGIQNNPRGAALSDGSTVFAWEDERVGSDDVYAQRILDDGTAAWTANGVLVCDEPLQDFDIHLVATPADNVILTWRDSRAIFRAAFAQMLDPNGNPQWMANGIRVTPTNQECSSFAVGSDGEGGLIVAWGAYDDGARDIFAQRIERNGYWGYPAPVIAGVRDMPGDQGGVVDLAWHASRLDPWPDNGISNYTVWRAVGHDKAAVPGGLVIQSPADLPAPEKLAADPGRSVILAQDKAGETYFWKLVSTVYAYHLEGYGEPVATLFDSTSVSAENHYFQVIAHGYYSARYWISEPDSGRSVDNLAPDTPQAFTGAAEYAPSGLQLVWDPNGEPDLAGYALHRGTSPDFAPSAATLLAAVPDTAYFDPGWSPGGGYHYKLAAVDEHENVSGYRSLDYGQVSGTGEGGVPAVTRLMGNHPNPFNPQTTITFELAGPREVRLRVYDVAGRLIRSLAGGRVMSAGRHRVAWDGHDEGGQRAASGVYFYTLEVDGARWTRAMVLVK